MQCFPVTHTITEGGCVTTGARHGRSIRERMRWNTVGNASLFGRVLLLLLTFVLIIQVPVEKPAFMSCPSRLLFSVPCPLCGLTRAVHSLAGGDVKSAVLFNPLVVFIGPWLLYLLIDTLFLIGKGRPLVQQWPCHFTMTIAWAFGCLFVFLLLFRLVSVVWPGVNPQGLFLPP